MSRVTLCGWGRTSPSVATLDDVSSESEIAIALASSRAIIARGLGRSYGDAAQVSGGTVLRSRIGDIGPIDDQGVVLVGAGASLDELLSESIPQGWFPPVTPGTRQVTIGGAIAADVHGKNHHVDGSFARHVIEMRIVTPGGGATVSPSVDPELFLATMGGMGLTGVITAVTLKLLRIETDQVLVDTQRFPNLDEVMSEMTHGDENFRYSVAWVDCMTRGAHLGRSILTAVNTRAQTTSNLLHSSHPHRRGSRFLFDAPNGLLNPLTIRAFNEAWFRSSPRLQLAKPESISSFFHPSTGSRLEPPVRSPRILQYRSACPKVPATPCAEHRTPLIFGPFASFLAVLKRFGPSSPGPLSFPMPGWTLALDLAHRSASLTRSARRPRRDGPLGGGRIYLAKDARLSRGEDEGHVSPARRIP